MVFPLVKQGESEASDPDYVAPTQQGGIPSFPLSATGKTCNHCVHPRSLWLCESDSKEALDFGVVLAV